jgi:hypothetical protein
MTNVREKVPQLCANESSVPRQVEEDHRNQTASVAFDYFGPFAHCIFVLHRSSLNSSSSLSHFSLLFVSAVVSCTDRHHGPRTV